jgi:hypothetical protein
MLFTGSVAFVGSLVPRLLVLFVCLGLALWGLGGVVRPLCAFSLVWSLLVSFLLFGLAGLGCSGGGWSFSFFFFFIVIVFWGHFMVLDPYTHQSICSCVIYDFCRGCYL